MSPWPGSCRACNRLVAEDLTLFSGRFALPGNAIQTVFEKFNHAQAETLPIATSGSDSQLLAWFTEAYRLQRHAQELKRRRRDVLRMETGS